MSRADICPKLVAEVARELNDTQRATVISGRLLSATGDWPKSQGVTTKTWSLHGRVGLAVRAHLLAQERAS